MFIVELISRDTAVWGGSSADVCRPSRCPRTVDKTLVSCQYLHFYSSFLSLSLSQHSSLGLSSYSLCPPGFWLLSFCCPVIMSSVNMHQFACVLVSCVSLRQKTGSVQKSEKILVSLVLSSGCKCASSICNHTFLVTLGLTVDALKALFFFLSWIKRVLVNTPCNRSSKLEHIKLAVRVHSVR